MIKGGGRMGGEECSLGWYFCKLEWGMLIYILLVS